MQPRPLIPGYDLLACLGGGPMTVVYSAREAAGDRPCAVKLIRPECEDPATAAKLLQREARAGLAVRHPRLVRLLDAHVLSEPYYLTLELLPGESLRRRLRRDYRLPPADAVWAARQTAEALAALHRAGFVHGDVKPDNVLIADGGWRMADSETGPQGQAASPERPVFQSAIRHPPSAMGTAALIDLGFAHRPGENDALFGAGYVLGSPSYLAPELCAAEPRDGPASDLFSLGATLFELLTGRLPYPPGTLRQTIRRHRCDPPADIRPLAGRLPEALVQLVQRLLAHRPEDRPRAAAVVQQLVNLEIAELTRRRAA